MKEKINLIKELEKIDSDLVGQFKDSLENVKDGRIRRVACPLIGYNIGIMRSATKRNIWVEETASFWNL